MPASTVTDAIVTYVLLDPAAPARLTEVETWFATLFASVKAGTGGDLLASSIVGRTFSFAPSGYTVQQSFNSVAEALNLLKCRTSRKTVRRF